METEENVSTKNRRLAQEILKKSKTYRVTGSIHINASILTGIVATHGVPFPDIQENFAFNGHKGYLEAIIKAMKIHTAKNTDYSGGGGPGDDPLANFKGSEELGIDPGLGIILRMQDKFMRVKAFAKTGKLAVADEGVEDAMTDIANYALLYLALMGESTTDNDKSTLEAPGVENTEKGDNSLVLDEGTTPVDGMDIKIAVGYRFEHYSKDPNLTGKIFVIVGASKASPDGQCFLASIDHGWSYTGEVVSVVDSHNITEEELTKMMGGHRDSFKLIEPKSKVN